MSKSAVHYIPPLVFGSSVCSIIFSVEGFVHDGYALSFLLPLTFIVSSIGIYKLGVFNHLYSSIVYFCYFVRMVITPIAMSYGGFFTIIPASFFQYAIPLATILICIENVVVFWYLKRLLIKTCPSQSLIEKLFSRRTLTNPSFLYVVFIMLISAWCVAIVNMDPSISKHVIVSLIEEKDEYFALSDSNTGIGTLSMFVQILSFLIKIVQITLPPVLLYYICKIDMGFLRNMSILALFFLLCTYGTEDRIFSLIAGASFFFTVTSIFQAKKVKSLAIILGVGFILVAFGGLFLKTGQGTDNNAAETVSASLCAYFSGLPTVAVGVDYVIKNGFIHFFDFFTDAISKVPFVQYAINLFFNVDLTNTNSMFNNHIQRLVGMNLGQIFPTSCLGMWYFSILLFPVYPCLLVRLANYFNNKISTAKNIFEHSVYGWITICVSMSPVVFSGLLLIPRLSIFYIVIVIVKVLNRK